MSRHNKHRRARGRSRAGRGMAGTAAAAAAMVALTASQGPGFGSAQGGDGDGDGPGKARAGDRTLPQGQPSDDSYHTELPPLASPEPGLSPAAGAAGAETLQTGDQAGIPATVLAAYKRAEAAIGRTDPGCHLPWELLAAIGKVESGHARGGAVDANGTTRAPILGPQLNGNGFASISDTDGGRHDGDAAYDRAVGPMQFIPSTWAGWAADGNGDGTADPNNVYDAALAAGHYLCAGSRDLSQAAGLHAAILSYNHSGAYLRTVLSWLDFYRKGTHAVPDGTGVLPSSPGPGNPDSPSGKDGKNGDGIQVGKNPGPPPNGGGGTQDPSDPDDDPSDPGDDPSDPGDDPSDPGDDPGECDEEPPASAGTASDGTASGDGQDPCDDGEAPGDAGTSPSPTTSGSPSEPVSETT